MAKRVLVAVLALTLLLAPPAGATWSIVVIDLATGEVGVASATCLEGFDLEKGVPVIVVGKGAGAAQSAIDVGATNRKKMFAALMEGQLTAAEIVQKLKDEDLASCSRQYGVVNNFPTKQTFTGNCAGAAKTGEIGIVGSLAYAIQGNVLTGKEVITAAEAALLGTSGRLSDRVMAAMEAARALGGDGRCSCDPAAPTSCGVPPPEFEKSAHAAFIVIARLGDVDGPCNGAVGCAAGEYWLNLDIVGFADDPDPVLMLEGQYADFLAGLAGHPDGLLSDAQFDDPEVLGDGQSTRTLQIVLYDVDGNPITTGGAQVEVLHAEGSAGLSTPGPAIDNGNGTYSVPITAGQGVGTDLFAVRVDDGEVAATLYPYPALEHRLALEADSVVLGAATGGSVGFDLLGPDVAAGRLYSLGLSASGSVPGLPTAGGVVLPLNLDRVWTSQPQLVAAGVLAGVPAELDGLGHGTASLEAPPGLLSPLAGLELTAAWFTLRPLDFASNPVTIHVDP